MAQKAKLDYSKQIKQLRQTGPERLYILYGEEDYLVESFFAEVKSLCITAGNEEFNYRKPQVTAQDLSSLWEAVEAVPFLSDRTLIELRDFDINRCKGDMADQFKEIVSRLPDYCTLVLIYTNGYEPDKRLAPLKAAAKHGKVLKFEAQSHLMLVRWIERRFAALEKQISCEDAEYLIYVSGGLMNRLAPEIEKLSVYSESGQVSRNDIDRVVQRIPEADVFEMADMLSLSNFDGAMMILSDLLRQREHPIKLLSIIAQQFRRLYAARLAMDYRLGREQAMELCGIRFDFILNKLRKAAESFSLDCLADILCLCAEADLSMKSTAEDNEDVLNLMLMKIAMRTGV